jgi:D-arginine dehydrogenase
MTDFDFVIVGAGIAGASLAAQLAGQSRVLVIESEAHPGYHATGRSAAFWTESYGGPGVQPLTTASGAFLKKPPLEYGDTPFMHARGALNIGQRKDRGIADAMLADFSGSGITMKHIEGEALANHIPGLKPSWDFGLWEPDCCDIDVAALHAAYLRVAKQKGVVLQTRAALRRAAWVQGQWQLETAGGNFTARTLINAAGAWADTVATLADIKPLGITPYRRTMLQLAVEPAAPETLPLVIALDGSFYFKPDAGGRLWLSPHDETACAPCDAAPEESDVAMAIERLGQVVDWRMLKLEHTWAGLRSFAPDRLPVIGADPANPAFFWFAGQGGFGIQTAPAAAMLAGSLLDTALTGPVGVNSALYGPERFGG